MLHNYISVLEIQFFVDEGCAAHSVSAPFTKPHIYLLYMSAQEFTAIIACLFFFAVSSPACNYRK